MSNPKLRKDMTGQRYGRLTVVSFAGLYKDSHSLWKCICDCGVEKTVMRQSLIKGRTQSCGCLNKEVVTKHGMYRTKEHMAWGSMIQRCENPKTKKWKLYGGRGIKVCERWRNSFEAFYEDVGPKPGPGHSLDRIDSDGNYEPGNVRWASDWTQNANRSNVTKLTFLGMTLPINAWERIMDVPTSRIRQRIEKGWSVERAITKGAKDVLYANLTGRLTKDAELRNAGTSQVCGFSVASNEKVKGEKKVTFIDCSMWGKRGEALAPYLKKGTSISVAGKLSTREYNGKTYLQIENVDQVELMGGGNGAGRAEPNGDSNRGDAYEGSDAPEPNW
jgi:single stranded DNA-binding protein